MNAINSTKAQFKGQIAFSILLTLTIPFIKLNIFLLKKFKI